MYLFKIYFPLFFNVTDINEVNATRNKDLRIKMLKMLGILCFIQKK